ncbi:MAG: hypothetical protein AB7S38_38790 [Vulcanimicrobiota bacterium]
MHAISHAAARQAFTAGPGRLPARLDMVLTGPQDTVATAQAHAKDLGKPYTQIHFPADEVLGQYSLTPEGQVTFQPTAAASVAEEGGVVICVNLDQATPSRQLDLEVLMEANPSARFIAVLSHEHSQPLDAPELSLFEKADLCAQVAPSLQGRPSFQLVQLHSVCADLQAQGSLGGKPLSLRDLVSAARQAEAQVAKGATPLEAAKAAALATYPAGRQVENLANFYFGQ